MSGPTLTYELDGKSYEAQFAVIDEVHLGMEDHGIYSVHIGWSMGASHHGTGHYALATKNLDDTGYLVNTKAAQFIIELMQLFGPWDKIKGTECLALYPEGGGSHGHKVLGLAQLPTRGEKYLIIDEVFNG